MATKFKSPKTHKINKTPLRNKSSNKKYESPITNPKTLDKILPEYFKEITNSFDPEKLKNSRLPQRLATKVIVKNTLDNIEDNLNKARELKKDVIDPTFKAMKKFDKEYRGDIIEVVREGASIAHDVVGLGKDIINSAKEGWVAGGNQITHNDIEIIQESTQNDNLNYGELVEGAQMVGEIVCKAFPALTKTVGKALPVLGLISDIKDVMESPAKLPWIAGSAIAKVACPPLGLAMAGCAMGNSLLQMTTGIDFGGKIDEIVGNFFGGNKEKQKEQEQPQAPAAQEESTSQGIDHNRVAIYNGFDKVSKTQDKNVQALEKMYVEGMSTQSPEEQKKSLGNLLEAQAKANKQIQPITQETIENHKTMVQSLQALDNAKPSDINMVNSQIIGHVKEMADLEKFKAGVEKPNTLRDEINSGKNERKYGLPSGTVPAGAEIC